MTIEKAKDKLTRILRDEIKNWEKCVIVMEAIDELIIARIEEKEDEQNAKKNNAYSLPR